MCLFSTDKTRDRVEPWDEAPRHRSYYSADRRGSAKVMRIPRASDSYTTIDRYSEYDHNRHNRSYVEDDYVRRRRGSVRSTRDHRDRDYRDRDSYYSDDETEVEVVRRHSSRARSRSRVTIDPVRRRSQSRANVTIERRPSRRRRKSSVSRSRVEVLRPEVVVETRSPPKIRRAIMPAPPALGYGTAILEPPRVARVNAYEYRRDLVPEAPPPPIIRTPGVRPITPVAPVGSMFGYPQPEVVEDFVRTGEVETRQEVGEIAGIEVDKVRRESVGYPRYEIRAPRVY